MDRSAPIIPDYDLLRRIGRGSYGEVWLARSVTGLYRAVKVIYRAQFEDDRPYDREFAGIKRFEPVSRSHDSQMDILHVGRNDAGGYFYYVMELADHTDGGTAFPVLDPQEYSPRTLKAVLAERSRLTVGESLPLAIALADALAHLHSHGLVHRDIKPSNIIFVNGRPKLADIGLIAARDAACSFVGTEGFVPREGPGTPQADIFALGKVLYELWTGRDRLEFPSLPENLETLPDRVALREVNEVLLKASDPDPAFRYGLASDLKNDLELILAQKSVRHLRSLERKVRRGRKLAIAIAVAAGVIGVGWYQSHRFNRMAASQLAYVYVKNGQERLEHNDWLGALPWFAKALDLERGLPEREEAHRRRIANTLEWCPRLVALYSHFGPARYAFFDSGADRVLICYHGNTAQVWESATDKPITPKLPHEGQPFLGEFSPDGTRVATVSRGDGVARLWDARTGSLIGQPIRHGAQVRTLAFSPDNTWLATAGDDGTARLWRASDGVDMGRVFNHGAPVSQLVLSADSRQMLTAGGTNGLARVWDAATASSRVLPLELPSPVNAAQFSPDGTEVALGTASGEVCVWTPAQNSSRRLAPSSGRAVFRVVFSPDGSRLLTATEWSANLWNAQTGEPLGKTIPTASMLRCAEFSRDGSRFLLAGESRTALIYDGLTARPVTPLLKHGGEIYRAFFRASDDEWITASADGTVRRWSVSEGENRQAQFLHPAPVTHLLMAPDGGHLVTADEEGVWRRWSITPGATRAEQTGPNPLRAKAAAVSFDGKEIIASTLEGKLAVLSVDQLASSLTCEAPGDGVDRIALNPRRAQAALAAGDGTVWLWDWRRGSMEPLSLPGIKAPTQMIFSPDGATLAVASDRYVLAIRTQDPRHAVSKLIRHEDRVWHVGFSADGSRLMVASEDRVMRWWNPGTGDPLTPKMHGDGGIYFAEFSPDNQKAFTSSANYEAMIWNAATGRPMTPPFKPHAGLTIAAFSPEGTRLAAAGSDGRLQIWDALNGEVLTPPLMARGPITSCRFSPDGRWLVSLEDGRLVVCRPLVLTEGRSEEAQDRATLLSGYRVDGHGLLVPASQLELTRLGGRLLEAWGKN